MMVISYFDEQILKTHTKHVHFVLFYIASSRVSVNIVKENVDFELAGLFYSSSMPTNYFYPIVQPKFSSKAYIFPLTDLIRIVSDVQIARVWTRLVTKKLTISICYILIIETNFISFLSVSIILGKFVNEFWNDKIKVHRANYLVNKVSSRDGRDRKHISVNIKSKIVRIIKQSFAGVAIGICYLNYLNFRSYFICRMKCFCCDDTSCD